ncbi:MAG: hypothetical protein KF878_00030 [Planctomycetes bacterium]|nr:hypothetical protein [Planctomycetota bacterium]
MTAAEPSTPDPDYQRPRGRTDEERAAFWAALEREQAEERAQELARAEGRRRTVQVLAELWAEAAMIGGAAVLLLLVAWNLGTIATLLLAIFIALCVIASRLKR